VGKGDSVVRIIAACALAFFATGAVADDLVMDDSRIRYAYSFSAVGPRHFCDFATTMSKNPLVVKLTAAFITDDTKPKDHDFSAAYVVEAFVVAQAGNNSQMESKQIKVIAGRVISDVFNSDLHASRNIDRDLGALYNIPSEDSYSRFTSLMIRGAYKLAVELENHSSLIVNVRPTAEALDAFERWNKCSIAIVQHQPPPY
jgi:hypothetical protein